MPCYKNTWQGHHIICMRRHKVTHLPIRTITIAPPRNIRCRAAGSPRAQCSAASRRKRHGNVAELAEPTEMARDSTANVAWHTASLFKTDPPWSVITKEPNRKCESSNGFMLTLPLPGKLSLNLIDCNCSHAPHNNEQMTPCTTL